MVLSYLVSVVHKSDGPKYLIVFSVRDCLYCKEAVWNLSLLGYIFYPNHSLLGIDLLHTFVCQWISVYMAHHSLEFFSWYG